MSNSNPGSVTRWIPKLRTGNEEAAAILWRRTGSA